MIILWTSKRKLAEIMGDVINDTVAKEVDRRMSAKTDFIWETQNSIITRFTELKSEQFIDDIVARIKRKQLK